MKERSKVSEYVDEEFERKQYFENKNVTEARTSFKLRIGTFPCKMNRRGDPKYSMDLFRCDS